MVTCCSCLLFMLFSLLCCFLYFSVGNFLVISLFLYDYTRDLLFHHSFHVCNQMVAFCCSVLYFFCFGMLLSFLFGHSLICFTHPLVLVIISPISCMIAFCCSFFFWLYCCAFCDFIVSSSFYHSSFVVVFFPFILACCLLFCLDVALSFLFILSYFPVSLTLCTIAFHCIFPLLVVVFSFFIPLLFHPFLLFAFCHGFV